MMWPLAAGSRGTDSLQSSAMDAILTELLSYVPEDWQARFKAIVGLTDAFCEQHLTDEYQQLCREMATAICQSDSPAGKGKEASWAAGVVYTVGWVNFLTDPNTKPYLRSEDIAKGMGVSVSNMQHKSKEIRDGMDLGPMDPDWCLPSNLDDNPLVWLVENDQGMLVDLRNAPRNVQVQAYEQGVIPYVYADQARPNA
jgi:hypothetical protein